MTRNARDGGWPLGSPHRVRLCQRNSNWPDGNQNTASCMVGSGVPRFAGHNRSISNQPLRTCRRKGISVTAFSFPLHEGTSGSATLVGPHITCKTRLQRVSHAGYTIYPGPMCDHNQSR
ncbi:hypothetical protein PISMIDRAFT_593077 [Pisolithus microcarpus 441]|uniref:Uncharacterized protein n=1 Tax=Pisolithus microcarpus 441 TaxID=765257 RepID=A0A0C9ZKM9_9AGAM|nr:hypothetical protein PISMIDRAFT_593077 [Pisolithus microcarpus 441]